MEARRSGWAGRFIGLTFALGGVAWLVIGLLVLGNVLAGTGNYALGPASSRIVAGGGAGSWFTMGILSFLLVGIGGAGFTALFYQHIEGTLGLSLTGWRNAGAWVHLLAGGLGAAAASLLMAWGGFQAGGYLLGPSAGGGCAGSDASPPNVGACIGYVHTNFLSPIALPIAILMAVALLGYLVGGVVLGTAWMAGRKKQA
jgi:hypothetical protein